MPDLAATFRTLHHHMRVDSPTPWRFCSSDRGVLDEAGWSIAWVDDSPEQPRFDPTTAAFIVWMANSAEAIATALERGAAAEAAIAAFRVWRINQHSVQGWMGNGRLEVSMLTAMATYDALKEATDG